MLNIFIFLVSLLSFIYIQAGGMLFISELALAVSLLLLLPHYGQKLTAPLPKMLISLGLIWLGSQMLTDLIQSTPLDKLLKGWAAIVFFLIDFAAIYLLVGRSAKRARLFVFANALGGILQFIVAPTEYGAWEPWKWALATPVTMILLLYFEVKKSGSKFILLALMLLGAVDIYLNARSLGGMTVMTAVFVFVSRQPVMQSLLLRRVSVGKKWLLAIVSVSTVAVILSTYQWAAESGYLPEDVTEKYDANKSSSLGLAGLVLGGRFEFIASAQAVWDSPLIGHGSWPEDRKYTALLLRANEILGTHIDEQQLEAGFDQSELIPAHSHIMQSWVWAGALGAVFWIVILFSIFKALFFVLRHRNILQPIAVFFCVSAIWDILFSPFGSFMRWAWAIKLVVIWLAYVEAEKSALTNSA